MCKRIVVLFACALLSLSAFAQSAKSIYNKFSRESDVTTVYISPAMFKMLGVIPEIQIEENVDISKIVRNLESMYVINSGNPKVNDSLRGDIKSLIDSKKYEIMMEVNDGEEQVRFYTYSVNGLIKSFVMFVDEGDELSLIMFDGSIDQDDLMNLIASANK